MKQLFESIWKLIILTLISSYYIPISFSNETPEHSQKMTVPYFSSEEKEALAKPFQGITIDGDIQKNLFPIQSSGTSTLPIQKSVQDFLHSLSEEQQYKCSFPIDNIEWRRWHNTEEYTRQGIGLFELDDSQKILAMNILKQSLSLKGLEKVKNVMTMEEHLDYLIRKTVEESPQRETALAQIGQDQFYFTFMGEPSKTEPWGWQIDGHHLIINYFVLGDQVVMTPALLGSEPTIAEDGPAKGVRTFAEEEEKGLHFFSSLTESQKEKAAQKSKKRGRNMQAGRFRDNAIIPYSGIPGNDLNDKQQALFLDLIHQYVSDLPEGHAKVKMKDVKSHINETWFSWIGEKDGLSPFYYRIQSPVILIEFDHQNPVFIWDRSKPRPGPVKNHIHTVIRTPNGNDYGKDLLRQHLERHHQN